MSTISRSLLSAPALIACLFLVGVTDAAAAPITIDAVGDQFSVNWSGLSVPDGLPVSVESDWQVTAFNPTSVTFAITMENTSTTSPANFTGFGFNTDPNALSGTETSSVFQQVSVTDSSSFNLDVCVENNGNNHCVNNANGTGLAAGGTNAFNLTLNFTSTAGGITLSNFFARLEKVGSGNPDDASLTADAIEAIPPVPEPASLVLLGSGLAGLVARRRFRRRQ